MPPSLHHLEMSRSSSPAGQAAPTAPISTHCWCHWFQTKLLGTVLLIGPVKGIANSRRWPRSPSPRGARKRLQLCPPTDPGVEGGGFPRR